MFVLPVDTLKARSMFAPRSREVKKPYGASLSKFIEDNFYTAFRIRSVLRTYSSFNKVVGIVGL